MTGGIQTAGLTAGYGSQLVVHGVDLHVEPGELVALLGPNGAGKTTTLLAMAGAIDSSGKTRLFGDRAKGDLYERADRGLVFLPESRAVIRGLTVAENLRLAGCDVHEATGISPELEPLLDRQVGLLSGGEQQILSVTQAIVRRPAIVMADELSFGLAPVVVRRMLELMRRAADDGAAVLLVEQFARQVLEIADRAYVMRQGVITTHGPARYLLENLATVEASYLGGAPLPSLESKRQSAADAADLENRRRRKVLEGKRIVVTGVSSGIGAETAAELRRQGATVVGIDRNPTEDVDEFHKIDLTDREGIDAFVDGVEGPIHGLCNIAGLPPTAPAEAVLTVNALALRYLTETLVEKMEDGSAITHLASMAGMGWQQSINEIKEFMAFRLGDDVSGFADKHKMRSDGRSYFFTKEFVQVWTMTNRWTWRERGIRMNCVSPGPVDTPILQDFIETLGDRAEEDMRIMDRPGHPTDVAPVVAFLQSDASKWFRGANLTLDGGMSSHIMMHLTGFEK